MKMLIVPPMILSIQFPKGSYYFDQENQRKRLKALDFHEPNLLYAFYLLYQIFWKKILLIIFQYASFSIYAEKVLSIN